MNTNRSHDETPIEKTMKKVIGKFLPNIINEIDLEIFLENGNGRGSGDQEKTFEYRFTVIHSAPWRDSPTIVSIHNVPRGIDDPTLMLSGDDKFRLVYYFRGKPDFRKEAVGPRRKHQLQRLEEEENSNDRGGKQQREVA
jgi:hypothetical protein